ncbi:hypothetical protein D3C75_567930 [compost metagenome]
MPVSGSQLAMARKRSSARSRTMAKVTKAMPMANRKASSSRQVTKLSSSPLHTRSMAWPLSTSSRLAQNSACISDSATAGTMAACSCRRARHSSQAAMAL